MNDDLKAYVDGELPPDAAERVRLALDASPEMRRDAETLRALGTALRSFDEPMPVGRAATLAALSRRRPLWREWAPALAGCAAVLVVAITVQRHRPGRWVPVSYPSTSVAPGPVEVAIPLARREAFVRYVAGTLRGQVRRDGDGLRAFYPQAAHEDVKRRFLLPEDLAWPTDGLRVRLMP